MRRTVSLAVILLGAALMSAGCKDSVAPVHSEVACVTKADMITVCVQRPPSDCLQEGVELAGECNEKGALAYCNIEMDAPGTECYWKDPDNGSLWYNDGIGDTWGGK